MGQPTAREHLRPARPHACAGMTGQGRIVTRDYYSVRLNQASGTPEQVRSPRTWPRLTTHCRDIESTVKVWSHDCIAPSAPHRPAPCRPHPAPPGRGGAAHRGHVPHRDPQRTPDPHGARGGHLRPRHVASPAHHRGLAPGPALRPRPHRSDRGRHPAARHPRLARPAAEPDRARGPHLGPARGAALPWLALTTRQLADRVNGQAFRGDPSWLTQPPSAPCSPHGCSGRTSCSCSATCSTSPTAARRAPSCWSTTSSSCADMPSGATPTCCTPR